MLLLKLLMLSCVGRKNNSNAKIKDSGKQPVSIDMTFDSIPPFAKELPGKHKVRAENITQAYVNVVKFLKRYRFEFR